MNESLYMAVLLMGLAALERIHMAAWMDSCAQQLGLSLYITECLRIMDIKFQITS